MTTYEVTNKQTKEIIYFGESYFLAKYFANEAFEKGESVQVIEETQGKYENEFCVEIFNDNEILDF